MRRSVIGSTLIALAAMMVGTGGVAQSLAPGTSGSPEPAAPSPAVEPGIATLEIHAFDLGYDPAAVTVPVPGTYMVRLVNDGSVLHDVTFDGFVRVIEAEPGQSHSRTVEVGPDGIGFFCSIPGHAAAGMEGNIAVAGSDPAATSRPAADATPSS